MKDASGKRSLHTTGRALWVLFTERRFIEMKQYTKIYANNYCVDQLQCVCEECKTIFLDYFPANYELVCFSLEDGKKKFLPTYGKYGYLDLLSKLVDGWKQTDAITKIVLDNFLQKLQKIIPYKVVMDKTKCTVCGSYNIRVINRQTKLSPKVDWLEIDKDSLEQKM